MSMGNSHQMNRHRRIIAATSLLMALYLSGCKTSQNAAANLTDDEHSNIQTSDFRELETKPPHLSNGKIDVKHYDVDLKFSSMESTDVHAKTEIKLKLLKADRYVRLHMEKSTIQIKSAFISRNAKQDPITFKILDGIPGDKGLSGSVLRLDLGSEQPAGSELTLALDYTIKKPVRAATKGLLHRVDYEGEPIFATRNWPYYARYWLPSNDHPADTATFHFNISVPKNAVAAANGTLVSGSFKNGAAIGSDGLRRFEWDLSTPIPVYGVSVVVGELDVLQDTVCFDPQKKLNTEEMPCDQAPEKVHFVYYIQKKHREKSLYLKQAKEGVKQMILMSSILGPYPYQKLGFVTAPQDFNMESVSMMMMISPEATTHEVAHHWWGNTVYIEHWGDLWISEGLTSYFTGFYNEVVKGKYEECSSTEGVLNNPTDTDPLKIFNDTPYCKGAAAIADLRRVIESLAKDAGAPKKGRDAFLQVMRDLYETYKFKRLGSSSLVNFLRANTSKSSAKLGVSLGDEKSKAAISSWAQKWLAPTKQR
jgi:aminopeptidase N